MTQVDRKALKRAYLEEKKERGVYAVSVSPVRAGHGG